MANDLGGVWRTVGGRRIFIKDGEDLATAMKNSGKFKKKKQENPKYMWHGTSEENIESIKDNGFREDRRGYFATNEDVAKKNYGNNVIMLNQNDFNLKDVSKDVLKNGMPTDKMREKALKERYDGIKYKTSNSNEDVEILNIKKLNNVLDKTELENLQLTKDLGGTLTEKEEKRYNKLKSKK